MKDSRRIEIMLDATKQAAREFCSIGNCPTAEAMFEKLIFEQTKAEETLAQIAMNVVANNLGGIESFTDGVKKSIHARVKFMSERDPSILTTFTNNKRDVPNGG